jgi:hypothetical protein
MSPYGEIKRLSSRKERAGVYPLSVLETMLDDDKGESHTPFAPFSHGHR